MNTLDKEILLNRYKERIGKFGFTKSSLGWGKLSQDLRFRALLNPLLTKGDESILDVGCGFSDLYDYLCTLDWRGKYTGLDISPDVMGITKKNKPSLDLREVNILDNSFTESYDIIIACGIFNFKLTNTDHYEYLSEMIVKMFDLSNVGVSVDFISGLVDYKNEHTFYADFERILSIVSRISKRFLLNHSYAPFEYSVTLFKDQKVENNLNFPIMPDSLIKVDKMP